MDKQGPLTHFIKRIVSDSRLKPIHISLSIALCHSWMLSQFQHSYRISRRILMKASRIRSKATYHKTLKDLQMYGYIKYLPSYHPLKASEIMMTEDSNEKSDGNQGRAKLRSSFR